MKAEFPSLVLSNTALRLMAIALVYHGFHKLAFLFLDPVQHISLIWPPSGFALAILLLTPKPQVRSTLVVLSCVNLFSNYVSSGSLALSLGFLAANLLQAILGWWVLTYFCGAGIVFIHLSEVFVLIGVATLGTAVTSFIGAGTTVLANQVPFGPSYWTWWTSDSLGVLLITPLVVTWVRFHDPWTWKQKYPLIEAILFLGLWCATSWLVFHGIGNLFIPYPYFMMTLLVWAALRFGSRGVASAMVLLAAISISGITVSESVPVLGGKNLTDQLLLVQLFLGVASITGLLLSASLAETKLAEQALREDQLRLRALGDNLPNGMIYQVLLEPDGSKRFLHVSAGVERLNGISAESVLQDSSSLYQLIVEEDRPALVAAQVKSEQTLSPVSTILRIRRNPNELRWMQISSSPRRLADGRILWDGIQVDITDLIRAEENLRRVNRALRTLSNCNQAVVRAKTEAELLESVCQVIVENGDYRLAWVGYIQHDASRSVIPQAQAGVGLDYVHTANITWADVPRGRGPTGTAIRTGQPAVCHHFLTDPAVEPWRETAIKHGYQSSLAVPLKNGTEVFGALNVYSADPNTFDDDEISLLAELAADLTYGILALRTYQDHLKAEASLHLSEQHFRSAMFHSPIGKAIVAPDGRFLEVNPALCRLVGYSREELLTLDFQTITHPDDLQTDLGYARQLLERQIEAYQMEKRYFHKAGHIIWIQLNGTIVWNLDGTPGYFIAQIQDITDRRAALRALQESEERFRQVVENIHEVFWMVNFSTRHLLYISPGYERIWGRSCESLYQSPSTWMEAIHPDDRDRVAQALKQQAVGGYVVEYRIIRPDETIRWIRDQGFPIQDSTGQVYRIAGIAEDITEHRQIEAQLRQSQKMEAIGQLAGGVAHDFNNILGAIMLQAGFAQKTPDLSQNMHNILQDIVASAKRGANLTRQLLAFSRRQVLEPRELDLNEVVTNLSRMLQRIVGEDVPIELDLYPAPLITNADAGMLDQVLMNLVINARDATPAGGKLKIETSTTWISEKEAALHSDSMPGRYVCLLVSDTGCGISSENLPHIFEPFFTTKEPGKGTGLGLATVFGIVKQHQGFILVSSQPGQGTTVQVFLPASNHLGESMLIEAIEPSQVQGTETIMLVEDDQAVRDMMSLVLQEYGYRVLKAVNGVDALSMWENYPEPIQLVVTDIVMPQGINGIELAKMLRERNPSLKVIFTSGYNPNWTQQNLQLPAGSVYLQKPSSFDQILKEIRTCLDNQ
ncbi:MAG: PAS domain S-box protein [Acidobacteria bacterium]|nr:PAS domain S-box protein [Acidobacteriota bacterium]